MADKPRAIFEEVETQQKPVATPGLIDGPGADARSAIRAWLIVIFALVALIIAVGGMTRLTDSGLSITRWEPISGMIPPSGADDWQAQYLAYQETPEFQLQNKTMTLEEFKTIFWWEWGHRQLARVIGLVWVGGFFYFLARKHIPTGWTGRLFLIGALIGLQGAIGWWMVSSGLVGTMLDVASYRLAIHLGMAFVIFGFAGWYILHLGRTPAQLLQDRRAGEPRLFSLATGLLHLTFLQIVIGALVAGIDAGRAFPTWPSMNGSFLPPDPFSLSPWWRNFFEDAGLVQFVHRMVAYSLLVFGVFVVLRSRKSGNTQTRFAFNSVLAVLFLQAFLGIFTALYAAPIGLALLHQICAVALWALILRARFLARYPQAQSVRG